jgi:hypothetical protein
MGIWIVMRKLCGENCWAITVMYGLVQMAKAKQQAHRGYLCSNPDRRTADWVVFRPGLYLNLISTRWEKTPRPRQEPKVNRCSWVRRFEYQNWKGCSTKCKVEFRQNWNVSAGEVRNGPLDKWARKIGRAKQLKTYKMLRTLFSVKLLKSIVGSLCQYNNEMTKRSLRPSGRSIVYET